MMITRRTAITTSAAFASIAIASGIDAKAATAIEIGQSGSVDVLLVDETIESPRRLAGLVLNDGPRLPQLAVRLDAAGQHDLSDVFAHARAIVGISSGATLFCLERMAWDHRFRVTAHSQNRADDVAALQDLARFARGRAPITTMLSAPAYRPSRTDGLIHVWTMHKPARPATHPAALETLA